MQFAVANQFKLIAVTLPDALPNEAALISLMLEEGVSRVHLRKPALPEEYIRELLRNIPQRLHSRLSLHDAHQLVIEFPGVHLHLNSRNPYPIEGCSEYSTSCHSLQELGSCPNANYSFLSPIFDSISKSGYTSKFSLTTLRQASIQGLINDRVIALGGVTPHNIPILRELNFGGAAMLGYFWQYTDVESIKKTIRSCCNL